MTTGPMRLLIVLLLIEACLPSAFAKGFSWRDYMRKPDDWFRGVEGRSRIENILSNQSSLGSWPKNFDTSDELYRGDRSKIAGTFDNGATIGELRFLARAYKATGESRIRDAFLKGFLLVLDAQYPSGGFPQRFPTSLNGYDRYITFNDGTMVHILDFLRDVGQPNEFTLVDLEKRAQARRAFDQGIDCILDCQIKVGGVLTVWCAQHDPLSLEPRPGRTYELVSLSGGESAGILTLLMSLDQPSPRVLKSIEAGVQWYDRVKLKDVRIDRKKGDTFLVFAPGAPPLWARFYEIETNRPFFSGRDGVRRYELAEIEIERRNGYAWYGTWGEMVKQVHQNWKVRRSIYGTH